MIIKFFYFFVIRHFYCFTLFRLYSVSREGSDWVQKPIREGGVFGFGNQSGHFWLLFIQLQVKIFIFAFVCHQVSFGCMASLPAGQDYAGPAIPVGNKGFPSIKKVKKKDFSF